MPGFSKSKISHYLNSPKSVSVSDKKTDQYIVNAEVEQENKSIKTFRIFGIIAAVLLPVIGYVHYMHGQKGDPLIIRFILSANYIVTVVLTYVSETVRNKMQQIVEINSYIASAWFLSVIYFASLNVGYALGYMIIVLAITMITTSTKRLLYFLIYNVIATGITTLSIKEPEVPPVLYTVIVGSISVFLYFMFRAKFRAQDNLAIKGELLRNIFNESADSLFLMEAETALTIDCNDRAIKKFEANSKDDLMGISLDQLNKTAPTREELQAVKEHVIKHDSWQGEVEYKTFSGKIFWGSVAVNKVKLMEDYEWLIRITDISEKKAYEKKIELQNDKIMKSINYAQRIQKALLPMQDDISEILPEHFILNKPRDIVSGDFYWAQRAPSGKIVFAIADCTGHGVPGAFMSMIGITLMNEAVLSKGYDESNLILDHMKAGVIQSLKQTGDLSETNDGMDMSLCVLDTEKNSLQFTGACNSIAIIRNDEILEYRGDIVSISYSRKTDPFEAQTIPLETGDMIFVYSDGYKDQMGGARGRKFYHDRMLEEFKRVAPLKPKDQHDELENVIVEWQGKRRQIDDICVMGVMVNGTIN